MIPDLRLTAEPNGDGQADKPAAAGIHLLIEPQALEPIIRQVVTETLAAMGATSNQAENEGPPLWAWADVSEATRISEKSLRRRERDGSFGPKRVSCGSAVRFYRAEVLAWIAAGMPKRCDWIWRGNGQNNRSETAKRREK